MPPLQPLLDAYANAMVKVRDGKHWRSAARKAGPWRRGAYDAGRDLQLVHRRFRHRRLERRQGAARRVELFEMKCANCSPENPAGLKFCEQRGGLSFGYVLAT